MRRQILDKWAALIVVAGVLTCLVAVQAPVWGGISERVSSSGEQRNDGLIRATGQAPISRQGQQAAGLLLAAILLAGMMLIAPVAEAGQPIPAEIYDRARSFQRRRIRPERLLRTKTVKQVSGVSLGENANCWMLKGNELIAAIDKETGLISALTSLQPRRLHLLTPTKNGLLCYLWNRDQGVFDVANRVVSHSVRQGKLEGQPYLELSANLAFAEQSVNSAVSVKAIYRMFADRLNVCFRLDYLRTDPSQWEAGVFQAYAPRQWQRQVFVEVGCVTRALKPREKALERYFDFPRDATAETPDAPLRRTRYPYAILEGPDRLFFWGFLDISCFAVMTPNRFGGVPSFAIAPIGIKQGDGYSFDFTYKVLPKPRYEVADMCRWYAESMYSSNPITAGIVRLPKNLKPRVLAEGNVISGFYGPGEVGQEENHTRMEAAASRMKAFHLWYGGWNAWTEDHPVSGRFYVGGGRWLTAEGLKKDIADLRQRGFEVYIYFRQIRHDIGFHDDKPPYRDWMYLTEAGYPWNFMSIEGMPPPDLPRTPLPPEDRQGLGTDVKDYADVFIDLCDDRCREWFTKEVIASLDYYLPTGPAWDMGWGDILNAPCPRHPHTGLHHAILRISHDVYQWVKEHHPWMKVLSNEWKGSPTQLYCDGMMFEGGDRLNALTMESMKFYRTACSGLYYREAFSDEDWPPAVMRHLSYGITFGGRIEDLTRPPLVNMTALAAFSAKANNTPLVIERPELRLTPDREQITGSVWASKKRLLVAIFNNGNRSTPIRATLDRGILRAYGQPGTAELAFTALSKRGVPAPGRVFAARLSGADRLLITGQLGPKEMLLAECEGR
jgi:hypothetical protein